MLYNIPKVAKYREHSIERQCKKIMSYCSYCGKQAQEESAFCSACGKKLNIAASDASGAEESAADSSGRNSKNGEYSQGFHEEGGSNEKMASFIDKLKDAFLNTEDVTYKYSPTDISKTKGVAAIGYIPFLFFLPLIAEKGSPFGRFHANQGLLVTLAWVLAWLISSITFIGALASWLLRIVLVVVVIMFIINTASGSAKRLPFVGNIELIK